MWKWHSKCVHTGGANSRCVNSHTLQIMTQLCCYLENIKLIMMNFEELKLFSQWSCRAKYHRWSNLASAPDKTICAVQILAILNQFHREDCTLYNQTVIITDRYYDCDRIHGYGGIDHFCIKSFNVSEKWIESRRCGICWGLYRTN